MTRRLFSILTLGVLSVALLSGQARTTIAGGSSLPANCNPRDLFFKTAATVGLYECLSTNTWTLVATGSGFGDLFGPASATDNAIVRFDGTTGKLVQNSGITIADAASGALSGTNTGDQDTFKTIAVSGQSDVVADSPTDTLTLAAGSNITITTTAGTDTVTIASASGGASTSDHFVTTQAETDLSAEFSLGSLTSGILKHTVSGSVSTPATATAGTDYVAPGDVTTSGLTQSTGKILGRTTASTGAIEEIAAGTGLSLTGGTLSVTSAPAGGGGALTQIAQIVTAGSQTTVDFTSIPGGYSALKVVWTGQDTTTGTSASNLFLKINNDGTAGNYTAAARIGSSGGSAFATTSASTTSGVQVGQMPNAGNTNVAGAGEMILVGYAGTTFHKQVLGSTTNELISGVQVLQTWLFGFRWASTAAITRLTYITGGTAFTNGSTFTLYGMSWLLVPFGPFGFLRRRRWSRGSLRVALRTEAQRAA